MTRFVRPISLPSSDVPETSGLLLLEQGIEALPRVYRRRGSRGPAAIWLEVITEVCLLAIGYPFGKRFATSIVRGRIIVRTVEAAVDVVTARRALLRAKDLALNLQFGFTVMA